MKYRVLQWLGVTLILVLGIIHFLLAPDEYKEAHYIGILFGANFLAALISAVGILRGNTWAWVLGLLIVAGSLCGYILSRTTGMPGMDPEEWLTPSGLAAMAVEGVFILLVFLRPWRNLGTRDEQSSMNV